MLACMCLAGINGKVGTKSFVLGHVGAVLASSVLCFVYKLQGRVGVEEFFGGLVRLIVKIFDDGYETIVTILLEFPYGLFD